MASEGYHEPLSLLDDGVVDRHRVITSITEELEAVDWYDQRVAATDDESLAAVLAHNRDEEKEHAAMGIEWLRRHDDRFDQELRTYLFTDGAITEVEERVMGRGESAHGDSGEAAGAPEVAASHDPHSLEIGSLNNHQPKNHQEDEPT